MAGIISFDGYDGAVYLMGWTGGYVLLALYLPISAKIRKFTVPDFMENVITLTPQERLPLSVH
jgi:cation/acetate symporter